MFGRRLRCFRLRQGLKLNAVALKVGMSGPHLGRLELGHRRIYLDDVTKIANVYGLGTLAFLAQLYELGEEELQAANPQTPSNESESVPHKPENKIADTSRNSTTS